MATYYVRSSGGSNSNDGLSFANGWATIAYAEDTVAGGDEVLICADGIHAPTAYILLNNGTTSRTAPIKWTGANATGVVDGTIATISGASISGNPIFYTGTVNHWLFRNIRLTAGKFNNITMASGFSNGSMIFINCRIDSAIGDGVNDSDTHALKTLKFINTEIDNNSISGVGGSSSSAGAGEYTNCSIHNNTLYGLDIDDAYCKAKIIGCRIYRNGSSGVHSNSTTNGIVFFNNVFFDNAQHGVYLNQASTSAILMLNNIFRSNGGYGINALNTSIYQFSMCDYNCSHNNTSGDININGGVLPGSNNILSNPLFTSETIGLEDFSLQSGSPCLNVGYGYNGV